MNKVQDQAKQAWPIVFASLGAIAFAASIAVFRADLPDWRELSLFSRRAQPGQEVRPLARDAAASDSTVRFLLNRVKRDPDDYVAQNMLASAMLSKVRETGEGAYLERAISAAHASLRSVPAIRNFGGLSALTRSELAAHDFAAARDHALQLTRLDPASLGSWSVLADALLELGSYADADAAIQQMRRMGSDNAETEIRQGRILFLQSDTEGAERHFARALAFALRLAPPPRETVAWCRWQLGEMEFSRARYEGAEQRYREALITSPGYVQALASLGRVLAARTQLAEAIASYEEAVRQIPDPTFVGALGDLYHLAGRERDAQAQYALVKTIGRLSRANGSRYNRQIAIFNADHDQDLEQAYQDAKREYADRRDIYGADALAWAALKTGRIAEARKIQEAALALSTRDAKLLYHAGMIAQAAGDLRAAHGYLKQALTLNPAFDPLQSDLAKHSFSITSLPGVSFWRSSVVRRK